MIKTWQERHLEAVVKLGELDFHDDQYAKKNAMLNEIDELRAELDKLKQQEPVIKLNGVDEFGPIMYWYRHWVDCPPGSLFFLAAGASK